MPDKKPKRTKTPIRFNLTTGISEEYFNFLKDFFIKKATPKALFIEPNVLFGVTEDEPFYFEHHIIIHPKKTSNHIVIDVLETNPLSSCPDQHRVIFSIAQTYTITFTQHNKTLQKTTLKPRLVKISLSKDTITVARDDRTQTEIPCLENEHRIHLKLKKSNTEMVNLGNNQYALIMEKHPGQCLLDYFVEKAHSSPKRRLQLCLNILNQYKKLMDKGVLHRDIKLDHIIINPKTLAVEIIDFTLSILKNETGLSCGTLGYAAPEIIPSVVLASESIVRSEIFSLGRLIMLLLGGPEEDFSCLEHTQHWGLAQFKEAMSTCATRYLFFTPRNDNKSPNNPIDETKPILQRALSPNPSTRPNLEEMIWVFESALDHSSQKSVSFQPKPS